MTSRRLISAQAPKAAAMRSRGAEAFTRAFILHLVTSIHFPSSLTAARRSRWRDVRHGRQYPVPANSGLGLLWPHRGQTFTSARLARHARQCGLIPRSPSRNSAVSFVSRQSSHSRSTFRLTMHGLQYGLRPPWRYSQRSTFGTLSPHPLQLTICGRFERGRTRFAGRARPARSHLSCVATRCSGSGAWSLASVFGRGIQQPAARCSLDTFLPGPRRRES